MIPLLTVTTPAQLEELATRKYIEGDVRIEVAGPVELSRLKAVDGQLTVAGGSVVAPKLRRVGALVAGCRAEADPTDRFELPRLQAVHGDLIVCRTGARTVDLPVLEHVGDELRVQVPYELSAPALRRIGEHALLHVTAGPAEVRLPALQLVGGDLGITGDGLAGTTDLSGLVDAAGTITVGPGLRPEVDLLADGVPSRADAFAAAWTEDEGAGLGVDVVDLRSLRAAGGLSLSSAGDVRLDALDAVQSDLTLSELGRVTLGPVRQAGSLILEDIELVGTFATLQRAVRIELSALRGQGLVLDFPVLESVERLSVDKFKPVQVSAPQLEEVYALQLDDAWRQDPLPGPVGRLELPRLARATILAVEGQSFDVVALPALTAVERLSIESNRNLKQVSLPALGEGIVAVADNEELGAVDLSGLRETPLVTVRGAGSIDLRALVRADKVTLVGVGPETIVFPMLGSVESIEVAQSPSVRVVQAPKLAAAHTVIVRENPQMSGFDAPGAMVTGQLQVTDNPTLQQLSLDAKAARATVWGNGLSACQLRDRVGELATDARTGAELARCD